jgi:hypothetical protein
MTNSSSTWLKLPLLLPLLLLVPREGLAAQDAPLADPETPARSETRSTDSRIPGTEEHESPRLSDDGSWAREPQRKGAPTGLRLLAEVGAGSLTAVGGGLVGGLGGLGLCEALGGQLPYVGCVWGALFGAGLGLTVAYPVGVWWGGEATGGDGSLLAAFGGMGAGGLVGVLLGLMVGRVDEPMGPLLGIVGGLAAMSGPIIGYELSRKREPRQPRMGSAVASSRPRIQPLLSVTSRGALLGLGGSF